MIEADCFIYSSFVKESFQEEEINKGGRTARLRMLRLPEVCEWITSLLSEKEGQEKAFNE